LNGGKFNKICEKVYGRTRSALARDGWSSVFQEIVDLTGKFKVMKSAAIEAYDEPLIINPIQICSFEKTAVKRSLSSITPTTGNFGLLVSRQ
jgi:hypothetical protein